MDKRFKDKSAVTIIIDPMAQRRVVVSEVLKELGFLHVTGFKNCKEAVSFMESESIDWIIMPLMESHDINALQILRLISEEYHLHQIRTSLLIDESEVYVLNAAYELGLMSHHINANIRDVLLTEFQNLVNELIINKYNTVLTSSFYLRRFLRHEKSYLNLLRLEESLLDVFPGNGQILCYLAEALFLNEKLVEAEAVLCQIELLDTSLSDEVGRLRAQYGIFDDNGLYNDIIDTHKSNSSANVNALGIRNCVLIDPDSTVLFFVEKTLRQVGVENITTFESGEQAWTWMSQHPEPHVVIQEWRLPDLPGPMLLQRMRQHGFIKTLVVVLSSLVKPMETPLLREMGVAGALAKPFDPDLFFRTIVWVLQQDRFPTEQKFLENKIYSLLKRGSIEEAERLKNELFKLTDASPALINQIDAEFYFHLGEFQQAIQKASEALRSGGDSLLLLDLLGKSLVKIGDFEGALKTFEKAHEISPFNIERLCCLALAEVETGNQEGADYRIDLAKKIDSGSPMVREAESSIALVRKDLVRAKSLMDDCESISKILGYMNNRAVTLARCSKFEESIGIYKDIVETLPDRHNSLSRIVTYNLGLAYARYGDLEKARDILSGIDGGGPMALQNKIKSLLSRIVRALENGDSLNLFSNLKSPESEITHATAATHDRRKALSALEVNKGSLCCFRIFKNYSRTFPSVIKLLEQNVIFNQRDALYKAN